ncbi:MAG: 2Fe-2S iron-sulfur cluster-binding protein [Thermodesulfobacteriota bacterium]|jgi:bidirectional [NiFe] hydrogenase diaphorase subunit
MITFTIDGVKVEAEEGQNVLQVALDNGFDIPHLCYHEALEPYGACRLCQVEITKGNRTRLTTSCNYPVLEGIDVQTKTEEVIKARKMVIELLLARSPNVPVIKDLAEEYSVGTPRFPLDDDDCILCGLCERVCREIVGVEAISFLGRGSDRKVGPPLEINPQTCIGCGACAYICPTNCIKVEENENERTIVRWGRTLPMKKCKVCGRSFAPWFQLDYFGKITEGIPKDFWDKCPDCR